MSRIFFSSDLHLGHANILNFEPNRREMLGCSTVEEHDAKLIERFNFTVKPEDTLYLLGDIAWGNKNWHKVAALNGHKILIRGNHDGMTDGAYRRAGIQVVAEDMVIKLAKTRIRLSHYPYRYGPVKQFIHRWMGRKVPRDLHKRPVDRGEWLLHGHTHSHEVMGSHPKMIHVGVDAWGGPVPLESILIIIGV